MGHVLTLQVESGFLFAYQWHIWVYVFKYTHKGETLRLEIGWLGDWSKSLAQSLVLGHLKRYAVVRLLSILSHSG